MKMFVPVCLSSCKRTGCPTNASTGCHFLGDAGDEMELENVDDFVSNRGRGGTSI